jgi:uncharacterized protein YndB with AHSA1/START domain
MDGLPERVEREVELAAPPDEVWHAVTDADSLGEWLDAEVELDVRPGGAGTFRFPDGEVRRAMVREVDEGERLSFTWWPVTGPGVGRTSTVSFEIVPAGGGSRLRLVETASARTRLLAISGSSSPARAPAASAGRGDVVATAA